MLSAPYDGYRRNPARVLQPGLGMSLRELGTNSLLLTAGYAPVVPDQRLGNRWT
jgi:hypothetical protein